MTGGPLAGQRGSEPRLRRFDSCSVSMLLIRFSATWCGPCKAYAPVLAEYAKDKNALLETVDIDQRPDLVEKYGIKSVPTTILLDEGEEVARIQGARSRSVLERELNDYL